jgi:hypothetical protein
MVSVQVQNNRDWELFVGFHALIAASMLLRSLSAASQSLASKPMVAEEGAIFVLGTMS